MQSVTRPDGTRGPGRPTAGPVVADAPSGSENAHGGATVSGGRVAPGRPGTPRKSLQRHSVRAQVLDALRTALVGGELTPGAVYSAPALAEQYGVSATPIREAMQQLAREGAVEVVPNRGFRVSERSARDQAELAEVRALLEVPVMLGLARTVPAEQWEELRPLAAATVAAAATGDRVAYAEADRAFHRALLDLSGNRQLALVGDELHRRAQFPPGASAVASAADLLADATEHTALLDALAVRDLAVVEQLVREHFAGARPTR
ncbi:GntR family transcriptional regulator [Streptomyces sp. MTZ3.1]|uniref:GntR family transcriptional regulator n=1 Tax=Streptomyces meridianus TaxID=2938945 RepID=A0ABT0X3K6_9ACTN|nr:GntR family transcriptional regulator [Streptomyces meridianus]MCM2576885.1 GntR family transcriptional regulator [Streptomyces meridianus]